MSNSPLAIQIDQARCEAYGFCVEAAPNLLALDNEGYLHTLTDTAPTGERVNAEAAARVCPVAALKLVAEEG